MKLIDCIREIAVATEKDYEALIYDLVIFAHDREVNDNLYITYYTTKLDGKQVDVSSDVRDCIYFAAAYGNSTRVLKLNKDGKVESMF